MCLLPGVPKGTDGTDACSVDEVEVLKVAFSQACGGKGGFRSSLLIKAFL